MHFNDFIISIKRKIIQYKKLIITASVAIVLIIGGILLFFYFHQNPPTNWPGKLLKLLPQKEAEIDPKIKEFGLKIDKISVLAPIVKNVDGYNKSEYNKALENGIAHYKKTALPGDKGNIFIFGHSSNASGVGNYTQVFARLGELDKNDLIIVFYKNKEYRFLVYEKKVVEKTDMSVLKSTTKQELTLMTCWPIGSIKKRLVIKSFLVE